MKNGVVSTCAACFSRTSPQILFPHFPSHLPLFSTTGAPLRGHTESGQLTRTSNEIFERCRNIVFSCSWRVEVLHNFSRYVIGAKATLLLLAKHEGTATVVSEQLLASFIQSIRSMVPTVRQTFYTLFRASCGLTTTYGTHCPSLDAIYSNYQPQLRVDYKTALSVSKPITKLSVTPVVDPILLISARN